MILPQGATPFRIVGELGLVDLHITCRTNLKYKDPNVRFWAAWSMPCSSVIRMP